MMNHLMGKDSDEPLQTTPFGSQPDFLGVELSSRGIQTQAPTV
jgi:hypothetical protein